AGHSPGSVISADQRKSGRLSKVVTARAQIHRQSKHKQEKIMKTKAILIAMSLCFTSASWAQDWPARTVRVIVPYGPGSTPDTIARLIFDRVQKNTGETVIIENKSGAAGMIGTQAVAKADADGYTLVLAPAGPLATNSLLYKK